MEQWYKIKDYKDIPNDIYEISDMGECRKKTNNGWYILKQHPNARGGYLTVSLYSNKTQKTRYVCIHTLMKYYILGILDRTFINHKDGDKTNNELSNLEISNPLHNTHHAIDNKLFIANKNIDDEIYTIRNLVDKNPMRYSILDLKHKFKKTSISISRIIKGTVRKDMNLENLYYKLDTPKNRIDYIRGYILDDINARKTISYVRIKYKVDYQTIKNIIQDEINKRKTILK